MKKCPFCAEEIQDAAIKCRWCGEMLDPAPASTVSGKIGGDAPANVGLAQGPTPQEIANQHVVTRQINIGLACLGISLFAMFSPHAIRLLAVPFVVAALALSILAIRKGGWSKGLLLLVLTIFLGVAEAMILPWDSWSRLLGVE